MKDLRNTEGYKAYEKYKNKALRGKLHKVKLDEAVDDYSKVMTSSLKPKSRFIGQCAKDVNMFKRWLLSD